MVRQTRFAIDLRDFLLGKRELNGHQAVENRGARGLLRFSANISQSSKHVITDTVNWTLRVSSHGCKFLE